MQRKQGINLSVLTKKVVLSSKINIYKTENFINETKYILHVDKFVTKLYESILLNLDKVAEYTQKFSNSNKHCFTITTSNKEHTFYIRFGYQIKSALSIADRDIVFFHYVNNDSEKRRNDQRFINYLASNNTINITLQIRKDIIFESQFSKLYKLSHAEHVNFPLLSPKQTKIVTTEDQNILVQGVAGSGKTNICINKIIFTACRAYTGRILDSTFSRGLLIDTKEKIGAYIQNLTDFIESYRNKNVIFIDDNHKKAIENKLGIYFSIEDDDKIINKIKQIVLFLQNQVDYYLIEDMYKEYVCAKVKIADENYFLKQYTHNIKNHQLAVNLQKLQHLSYEVIFKEVYGLIHGSYDLERNQRMLTSEQYTETRRESFSKRECQTIYLVAKDYYRHLNERNMLDNNLMSERLLESLDSIATYSVTIIDEVQDMTEINLFLMKNISRKLFCVGDALQMINPSYFSFSYLKRLLYEKDILSVSELTNNYRNTKKIEHLIEELGRINITQFGTHSFVLKGESIEEDSPTSTIYIEKDNFINAVSKQPLENYTIIVPTEKRKEQLRKLLKNQEILTVAEIKGLERDTVILYNILTDNIDKWQRLARTLINRKTADENSVYRYYFNLFYVGISRAKKHLYFTEDKSISLFERFFKDNFEVLNKEQALHKLIKTIGTMKVDQDEMLERIKQFINLGQYENARTAANKIIDDLERSAQFSIIDISEKHIHHGDYRQAGIAFWEKNMLEHAKQQFKLSNDQTLIDLIDACNDETHQGLNIDILQFYVDVHNNESAKEIMLQVAQNDLTQLRKQNSNINDKLKKERKYG